MRIVIAMVLALALGACAKSPPSVAEAPAAPADASVPADVPEVLPPPEPADETPADDVDATPDDAGAASEPAADADEPPANTIAVGEPNPGAPGIVDTSCRTDADCAIKDVGSCCGYRPACVNAGSPTFAEQVKAQCAKDGRMGICGFPAITGCRCNAGTCEGTGAGTGEKVY
jgi:hypothetical protein